MNISTHSFSFPLWFFLLTLYLFFPSFPPFPITTQTPSLYVSLCDSYMQYTILPLVYSVAFFFSFWWCTLEEDKNQFATKLFLQTSPYLIIRKSIVVRLSCWNVIDLTSMVADLFFSVFISVCDLELVILLMIVHLY